MENSVFHKRKFFDDTQVERFIRFNQITKDQIVSINDYSSYHGSCRYVLLTSINFYYKGEIRYEFGTQLSDERLDNIKNRTLNFDIGDDDKTRIITDYLNEKKISVEELKRYLYKITFCDHRNLSIIHTYILPVKSEDEPEDDFEYLKFLILLNPDIEIRFTPIRNVVK